MVLIVLSCAWLAGILIGWYNDIPWFYSLVGLVPLVLLFFIKRRGKLLITFALALIILPLAAGLAYTHLNVFDERDLRFYNDRGPTELTGVITEAPDVRDNNTRLKVSIREIYANDEWIEVDGTFLVYVPRFPAYEYGDFLSFTGVPESRVYAVASFYAQFRFTPIGKNRVSICRGTACHVRGAQRILEETKRQLNVEEGGTTEDLEYTLETVACIGCCALAPCMVINEKVESKVTTKQVESFFQKGKKK